MAADIEIRRLIAAINELTKVQIRHNEILAKIDEKILLLTKGEK